MTVEDAILAILHSRVVGCGMGRYSVSEKPPLRAGMGLQSPCPEGKSQKSASLTMNMNTNGKSRLKSQTAIPFLLVITIVAAALLWANPAISRAQNLYVSNYGDGYPGSGTVGEYNPINGAAISTFGSPSGLDLPYGIAISGSDLYVANYWYGTVVEYNVTTGATINSSFIQDPEGPCALAISGTDLYVSNLTNDSVNEYNSTTGATIKASLVSGLNGPEGLAVSGTDLYVTQSGNAMVSEYNATTGTTINGNLIADLAKPYCLTISGSDIYVADALTNKVGEYDANTGAAVAGFSSPSGLDYPWGMAVSGTNLYVANFDGSSVGEYNATTGATIKANFITGLAGPQFIAISPVPEPGQWALIASGLGLLGAMHRPQRKRQK